MNQLDLFEELDESMYYDENGYFHLNLIKKIILSGNSKAKKINPIDFLPYFKIKYVKNFCGKYIVECDFMSMRCGEASPINKDDTEWDLLSNGIHYALTESYKKYKESSNPKLIKITEKYLKKLEEDIF